MKGRTESEQARINAWFDATYRRKGKSYLRPVKAYYIYLELLEIAAGDRLLDAACGMGMLLNAAREYECESFGVDLSATALSYVRDSLPEAAVARANLEQLPFNDDSFDRITCIGSLERVINVRRALAEMKRVAKTDARFCFLVRNSNTLTWRFLSGGQAAKRSRGHQGADTLQNWRDLFESSGFSIMQVLPDQYPIHRRKEWSTLKLKSIDYRQRQPSILPLNRANEFIFLLQIENPK
jgi:SAM-dependent methyltransferase